ncbi:MAG: CHC2 zinc finger domain-containing protein, partial [Prevotella sp.]
MNIDQATRISIVEFLSWLGHRPVRQKGCKYWYVSPFRHETKPSFKVNMEINMWYDFGEGAGGGIISLAKRLYNTNDVSMVLRRIQDRAPSTIVCFSRPTHPREPQCTMKNVVKKPLESSALLDYARRRGISSEVVKRYCKEISYEIYGRRYFTIA